jgi:hypothetical protein
MREAEVIISAGLIKGMLVHCPCARKDSLVAVHVIERTKLSIDGARIAAGDAVAVAGPGPSHRVARRDVDCVRHEHETRPHRDIDNLAGRRWHSAHGRVAVLIHNADVAIGGAFLLRLGETFVARFSLRQRNHRKHRCQAKSKSYYCV